MHNLYFLQKRFPRIARTLALALVVLSLVGTMIGVGVLLVVR